MSLCICDCLSVDLISINEYCCNLYEYMSMIVKKSMLFDLRPGQSCE